MAKKETKRVASRTKTATAAEVPAPPPRAVQPAPMTYNDAAQEALRHAKAEGEIQLEPQTAAALHAAEHRPAGITPKGLLKPISENIIIASGGGLEEDGRRARYRAKKKAAVINACDRVMVIVPLTENEKQRIRPGDLTSHPLKTVTIDGYNWSIRKGVPTAVPLPVYDILLQRGHLGA